MEKMFKPGDKVLCIDDYFYPNTWVLLYNGEKIKLGNVYTIREYYCDNYGIFAVRLKEIKCPIHPKANHECGWGLHHFKKIDNNETIKSNENCIECSCK
jgi:hypothetical protein